MTRRPGVPGQLLRALECAFLGAALCVAAAPAIGAAASDPKSQASDLSNGAFALLNSLNAQTAQGTANPVIGQVAGFAGDAQTLSQALGSGDNAGAQRAMGSLQSDAAALDAALKDHPNAVNTGQWSALKQQLAALEKSVPAAPPSAAAASAVPAATAPPAAASLPAESAASAANSAGSGPGPSAPSAPSAESENISRAPRVQIDSRTAEGDITRIKGFFEGANLKSAGIYEGGNRVKAINVDHILGLQKVEFELALRNADIGTNIRVYDHAGRKAIASVFGGETTALAGSDSVGGIEVDRGSGSTSNSNAIEIPSHGRMAAAPPEPDLGAAPPAEEGDEGGLGGEALGAPSTSGGNVQINVTAVNVVNALSHIYQVTGHIAGRGVLRAGIYVDGRLVKRLPVSSGSSANMFDTTFIMNGVSATIRAFAAGNQYVESSIQMPPPTQSAPPAVVVVPGMSPYGMNPYGGGPFGINPFGIFGSNPYGASPYGSPYGYNPYGASPYGMNPYGTPYGSSPPAANPWGNASRPPGASGW
jgi:hypothetical protein